MLFPPRYARWVFAVLMSIYMVTLMTFVITWANTGLSAGFVSRWWRAFYIAWPIAFCLILIGAPRLQKLTAKLLKEPSSG
jgi:membrane protein implicated in regulation of membrane protease activity